MFIVLVTPMTVEAGEVMAILSPLYRPSPDGRFAARAPVSLEWAKHQGGENSGRETLNHPSKVEMNN